MKKYWDNENERVWTEDELRIHHATQLANGELDTLYSEFDYWLNCCLASNNGVLEPCADDVWVKRLRRSVASDIACDEMEYNDCLKVLEDNHVFENWTLYEINHRPVDLESLSEMVAQSLEGR